MTSTIKVNNIQNQCGANIINENSNTITLGASGDTIALASGASQTGFGRTGTVDWQTSSIKTTTFTAANGEGYFCNTTSGGFTVNLPAGVAGYIVSIQDYNNTFDTGNLTIAPNGSEKINGGEGSIILATEGQGLTLVYIDSTVGWRAIEEQSYNTQGSNEIIATGGTITTSGDDKIHTFTGPGTFAITQLSATPANNEVSYMVVAGGGGGGGAQSYGGSAAGGGGAGGFRETKSPVTPYTASPLDGQPSAPNRITVTASPGSYPITVGGGGTTPSGDGVGGDGNPSVFSTITSTGGGGGAGHPTVAGRNGGSGGGAGASTSTNGSGNTPPTTPSQGSNGGPGTEGAGGGGATAVGGPGSGPGQAGGAGATTSINATPTAYAGGGGGGNGSYPGGPGGTGGGGPGGPPGTSPGTNGTDNTGGGGGGGPTNDSAIGGTGGSGIVIIRYKFQ